MRFLKSSINLQIIALAFLSIFITSSITGIMSYIAASNSLLERLRNTELDKLLESKSNQINNRLTLMSEISNFMTNDPEILLWLNSNQTTLPTSISNKIQNIRNYFQVSYIGLVKDDTKTIYFSKEQGKIDNYYLNKGELGSDWYFQFLDMNLDFRYKLDYNPKLNNAYVFSNQRVLSNKKIIGEVSVGLDFTNVVKQFLVEDYFKGKSWLVDENLKIMVSSNISEVDQNISTIFEMFIVDKIKSKKQDLFFILEENIDNESIFLATRKIPKLNWYIIYKVDYNKVTKPLSVIKFLTFIGGITSAILTMLGFYYLSKRITKPIKILTDAADEIASNGILAKTINIQNTNEIGKLAKSFNLMSERLESLYNHIENVTKEKTKLSTELQIAKKIQTSLLPKQTKIDGYQIYCYMETADEVGGDYYDIIKVKNLSYLVIGDVSGHGLTAGLIMMMVQTSIHTILENNTIISPKEVLYDINKAVFNNIQLLGVHRYMTLQIFQLDSNGKMIFSGAHLPILIYRHSNTKVEVIEISGSWIGAFENIDGLLEDYTSNLNDGDILFLYTDGLVEATLQNTFFDIQNIIQILETFYHLTPTLLKEKILNAVSIYQKKDDISFMIIKKETTNTDSLINNFTI
jgi:serine phosphatase RsbU (regulator of sigma subunit)